MTKQDILSFLCEKEVDLKIFGVKQIGLFGSYVRERSNSKSDIDVLVVFQKNMDTFDNYFDLKFFLEDELGIKVDLVIKQSLKPAIGKRVRKEVEYALL